MSITFSLDDWAKISKAFNVTLTEVISVLIEHSQVPDGEAMPLKDKNWVLPQRMFVETGIGGDVQECCDLASTLIPTLPKSYFHKNGRQPNNKGQMHIGWTSFSGPQTTAICGLQMPYQTAVFKKMGEKQPTLLKSILTIVDYMWERAVPVFGLETAEMLKVSATFRLGHTGFNKISSGTNLDALWHVDSGNLAGSIQCVMVLGDFVGGEVRFDPHGRSGSMRTHNTKSNGSEDDVIIVPNQHGTLFVGKYESVWHSVNAVTKGNRTIIAAYASQTIKRFDDVVIKSGKYTFAEANDLKERRKVLIKGLVPKFKDLTERAHHRKVLTDSFVVADLG